MTLKEDFNQLYLLLWKNFRVQLRSPISLLIEILSPALFAIILLPIRTLVKSDSINQTTLFEPFHISNRLPFPISNLKVIAYQPNNVALVNDIMKQVGSDLNLFPYGFRNEDEMADFAVKNSSFTLGGISFLNTELNNFKYKIRLSHTPRNNGGASQFDPDSRDWRTQFIYMVFPIIGPRNKLDNDGGSPGYNREGFLSLQKAVDLALIGRQNSSVYDVDLQLKRFPYPPYEDDQFIVVLQFMFPFIIMMSFIVAVILTAKSIVHEKETGIRESMRLMGMKPWIYWLSWYIKTLLLLLPSTIFMIITYKAKIKLNHGGYGAILNNTDALLFGIFLFLYVSSSITFTFLCTTFFKKANSAAAGAGVIWFFSYLPFIFIQVRYEKMTLIEKTLALFVNNLAMSEGVQLIGIFEGKGVGINFNNWTSGVSVEDKFSMFIIMIIMLSNNFIHLFMMYYLDNVRPGDHGIAKPWYFPIAFLLPKQNDPIKLPGQEKLVGVDGEEIFIEDESMYSSKNIGIQIKNIFKFFKQLGRVKCAVNDLCLNIYESQITVLLGHNGAGKSTTMAMITGLTKPSKGNILINGKDIVNETKEARKVLGFCPQHNLLFDDMTVYEHLKFFAKLKNNFDEHEIDSMLETINLADKKHALSKTLSGGMKRKLSVSIAFIGKSNIVLLDEPSSGMDPQARHATWSLLQKFKKERNCTILLTTHFMDEADILGDRIAIMSKGTLRCCGSPLYLKSKYSSGYNLVLTRKNKLNDIAAKNITDSKLASKRIETDNKIITFIKNIIEDAKVNENLNSEISFVLPAEQTPKFSELFRKLDANKDSLGVNNIGISISTLEDVFLKINEDEAAPEDNEVNDVEKEAKTPKKDMTVFNVQEETLKSERDFGLWTGSKQSDLNLNFTRTLQQFWALLQKRFIHAVRNKILTITQLLIPIGVMLLNLIYLKYGPVTAEDSPPLEMDISKYDKNFVPVLTQFDDNMYDTLGDMYRKQFDGLRNTQAYNLNDQVLFGQCSDSTDSIDDYLSCIGIKNFNYLDSKSVLASTLTSNASRLSLIAHFNNQPYHTPSLALNSLTTSLLKYFSDKSESKITVVNHPLPRNLTELITDLQLSDPTGFNVASGLTFGFGFLLASFVVFLIKEKTSNSRHLQYMSGCSSLLYWSSAFFWDMVSFMIPTVIVIILLWAFDVDEFIGGGRWLLTITLIIIYGLSHTPQMYLLSYAFKISASGLAALTVWNILTSQATLTPVSILTIPQLELQYVADILEIIFVIIFPNYSLGQAMLNLYTNKKTLELCDPFEKVCSFLPNPCCKYAQTNFTKPCGEFDCVSWTRNYLSWNDLGLLKYYVFMLLQFVVQFVFLIMYDTGRLRSIYYLIFKKQQRVNLNADDSQLEMEREYGDIRKDDDVINEENRIAEMVQNQDYKRDTNEEIFVVDRLTKYYSGFMAVKGVSFTLKKADCFGLLGVNGAGKTTTFKMITGDEFITDGNAYLNRIDLKQNTKRFQSKLGYCPQFDPLIDQMTVLETMRMYANLRGIKTPLIEKTCFTLIDLLDLSDHSYKMCFTLSGGNKRKLSVAISLIGSPSIVLLDEPTSGMDPKTRRSLWNSLNEIRNKGKSLILTTHGMDETEVLCTNIGIMVNGEFKCLGSLQHLKSKYGEGYTLLAKIKLNEAELDSMKLNAENATTKVDEFIRFILTQVKRSHLKESRDGFVNIHISDNSTLLLSTLFSLVENVKEKYSIEYYVVTQTNLEQIFLNFASKQIDPETRYVNKKGCCSCCC